MKKFCLSDSTAFGNGQNAISRPANIPSEFTYALKVFFDNEQSNNDLREILNDCGINFRNSLSIFQPNTINIKHLFPKHTHEFVFIESHSLDLLKLLATDWEGDYLLRDVLGINVFAAMSDYEYNGRIKKIVRKHWHGLYYYDFYDKNDNSIFNSINMGNSTISPKDIKELFFDAEYSEKDL